MVRGYGGNYSLKAFCEVAHGELGEPAAEPSEPKAMAPARILPAPGNWYGGHPLGLLLLLPKVKPFCWFLLMLQSTELSPSGGVSLVC